MGGGLANNTALVANRTTLPLLLRSRLQGPLDERSAAYVVAMALLGLHHLHQLGIIYRGLSAITLLMTESGLVQLVDFRWVCNVSFALGVLLQCVALKHVWWRWGEGVIAPCTWVMTGLHSIHGLHTFCLRPCIWLVCSHNELLMPVLLLMLQVCRRPLWPLLHAVWCAGISGTRGCWWHRP